MKEIDARGLACPAPVLQTKAALQEENPKSVRVVVDNAASQQNVQRFLESQGFRRRWNKSVPTTLSLEIVIRCLLRSPNLLGASRRCQENHGHVRHRPAWLR